MKNHKQNKEEFDWYTIPLREIELQLTAWEGIHLSMYGKTSCSELRCMGHYVMILALYNYRCKVEKHKKVVDIIQFQKMGMYENGSSQLIKIVGFTARSFHCGDYVVLVNDLPETMNRYKVHYVKIMKPEKNGMTHFEANVEYKGFDQNYKNN